jgi:plasmid replication initiation protein
MYELLAQYKTIGIRDISLVDLRGFLGADDPSYDRLDNFKRKVLDLGVKQINELTDLDVSYVPERSGRSIIGYKFKIQTKPQDQLIKIAGPKPKAKKAAPAIPTGLTLAEKNMIKKICIKSGQSEDDVLANAQAMNVELFIALDRMIKAV